MGCGGSTPAPVDLGPAGPLPHCVAQSRTCDPLEGIYESFPIGGGGAVESFAFTVRGDQCATWGSHSGMNTYTMRNGVLHHHHHPQITAQVDAANRTLTWSHGYVSHPAAGEVPRKLAPALEGLYESFHMHGGGAVEAFAFTVRGGHATTWGQHSKRNDYSLNGNVLQGPVRCHVQPDGSFAWSHSYVSRRKSDDQFQLAPPEQPTVPAGPAKLDLGATPSHGNPASNSALNTELNNVARNTDDTAKARALVAEGADLASTNGPSWRHTPLHQAAYHGRYEMAKCLIELGAPLALHSNPCGRGAHGTPAELARGGGHHRIADMIEAAIHGGVQPVAIEPAVVEAVLVAQAATPNLGEMCAVFKEQLGASGNMKEVVEQAADALGVEAGGRPLTEVAADCYGKLGLGANTGARAVWA